MADDSAGPVYTVRIIFNPKTQRLHVEGPMHDSVLFLGMLESAKKAFWDMAAKASEDRIMIPELRTP